MSEVKQRGQTGTATIDPHENPQAYLKAAGWKCLGNPNWQSARWLDPTKPTVGRWTEIEVFAPNPKGSLQRVMADDGTGQIRPVTQKCFQPAAEPVDLQTALLTQMERDAKSGALNN